MPAYQIHRLKETSRQQFRWAPHASGVGIAKPKDYEKGPLVEAASPYALWIALRGTEDALQVGDLLELEGTGELRIFKYVGFEEARWYVPEVPTSAVPPPIEVT
jgi:hypothetical protein